METTATFLMIKIALVFIVGIEHIGICLLEIFGKPAQQAKAFDMVRILLSKKRLVFRWLIKAFIMGCWDYC